MSFANVANGDFEALNSWLRTRSYIEGYSPSQADVTVIKEIKSAPSSEKYPHASRWYQHILTYETNYSSLPGTVGKSITEYGGPVATAASETVTTKSTDDDIDLFGSDEEEDAEAARIREERLEEYRKKKEGKVKPAAKSIVTLDVKPWDDETDMELLEKNVRAIEQDGLVWGASKLVPVGYGIRKLQINLVVEDDKVSIDELQSRIAEDEECVQSTDVVAMQKL